MSHTLTFYVSGMTCSSCSSRLSRVLNTKLNQASLTLEAFDVDFTTFTDPKKTTIVLSESFEEQQQLSRVQDEQDYKELREQLKQIRWNQIKEYIDSTGFSCEDYNYSPRTELVSEDNLSDTEEDATTTNSFSKLRNRIIRQGKKYISSHWFKGTVGCVAGVAVLITCMTATTMSLPIMLPLAAASVILTLALGASSYKEAWNKWQKSHTLTMDSLFALSTSWILVISLASLYVPWLPMMFDAALFIYGFRHIGLGIEDYIKQRIGTTKFQDRVSKTIRRYTEEETENILLEAIEPGNVILVEPGEVIPLDGECCNEGIIYNTITTGAILPRYFAPNDKVLAGMRLAENSAPLKIRVTKNYANSYLVRLDARIEKATLDKSPIELQTVQLLEYFIPSVLLLAIAAGTIIGIFFSPALAIQSVASILVSACPCTLGLITPLAVATGMHKASGNGVQFKSSKILQQAKEIDTVIFDLNGTLTTGIPTVKNITVLDNQGVDRTQLLKICAALEKRSNHPTGKAIYAYSKNHDTDELEVSDLNKSHHSGVIGQIDRENYIIGSRSLMQKQGITIPPNVRLPDLEAGDDLVLVARDNTLLGFMVMTDPLREDAYDAIKALKAMGKKVHLCTGAAKETAHRYARALGIEYIYAECIAAKKTEYINELRIDGNKVAMIGDAGNDAEAMAASDFGIAISSGDEVTQEAAGAVIHTGALMAIPTAFGISQQTDTNIRQNLIMSFGYNFGMICVSGGLFACGIGISPALGVCLMMLQACLILLNVLRFKEQPISHLEDEAKKYTEQSEGKSSYQYLLNNMPTCDNTTTCIQRELNIAPHTSNSRVPDLAGLRAGEHININQDEQEEEWAVNTSYSSLYNTY